MIASILNRFWPNWRIEASLLTNEGRKRLYKAVQHVRSRDFLEWDEIYSEAFGRPFERGTDFESNFRSGRISRKRAVMLYRWLVKLHKRDAVLYEYDLHTKQYSSAAFREHDVLRFVERDLKDSNRTDVRDDDHPPQHPPSN